MFKFLASVCGFAVWFEFDMVETPKMDFHVTWLDIDWFHVHLIPILSLNLFRPLISCQFDQFD